MESGTGKSIIDLREQLLSDICSCQYLAAKFECDDLERDSVCLCDDDNDIEMAKACGHAYLPAVTSASLEQAISEDPNHFTKLEDSKIRGTRATDAALAMVLDLISSR